MGDIRWNGHQHFKDAAGQPLDNAVTVEVGAGKVRAEIRMAVGKDDAPEVVETDSRQVAHHYRKLDAALRAKQYRHRPITTRFKPPQQREPRAIEEPPMGMVACPRCIQLGTTDPFCDACDGDGQVTRRRRDEWLADQADLPRT